MSSNPYGLSEGETVEEQSVYQPQQLLANGAEHGIELGQPEQIWEDYALEILPIKLNGSDTGRRFIMRNGEMLGDVSNQYRLIPNEEVVQAADKIAEDLGASKFHDFGGDWYIKLQNNVFMDKEGRRAHALYAWDDPVDIGGTGEVQLGFGVHNSIDGSMGLRVGLFTFRHACANMVFMGVNPEGMSFDQRDVLAHSTRKHTHGLKIDHLRAWIENTVQYGSHVIDAYNDWQTREIERQDALKMLEMVQKGRFAARDTPEWVQNAVEYTEELEQKVKEGQKDVHGDDYGAFENGLPRERVADVAEAYIPAGETHWDTYNHLTEAIWHNSKTNDQSKISKMRNLHKAFDPSPVGGEVTIR